MMPSSYQFKLVGMTFAPGYPDNLYRLRDLDESRKADALGWFGATATPDQVEQAPLVLFRNPSNEHDHNAIEVHAPLLGRRSKIGHVPRDLAAKLAPSLDSGDEWHAWLDSVLVDPEHEANPGVLMTVRRK